MEDEVKTQLVRLTEAIERSVNQSNKEQSDINRKTERTLDTLNNTLTRLAEQIGRVETVIKDNMVYRHEFNPLADRVKEIEKEKLPQKVDKDDFELWRKIVYTACGVILLAAFYMILRSAGISTK